MHGLLESPLCLPATVLSRHSLLFCLKPPPHVCEHSLHTLHSVSSGHGSGLHSVSSVSGAKQGLSSFLQGRGFRSGGN